MNGDGTLGNFTLSSWTTLHGWTATPFGPVVAHRRAVRQVFCVGQRALGHPLYSLFPILAPLVFKFYHALLEFRCPPSYVMGQSTTWKRNSLHHRTNSYDAAVAAVPDRARSVTLDSLMTKTSLPPPKRNSLHHRTNSHDAAVAAVSDRARSDTLDLLTMTSFVPIMTKTKESTEQLKYYMARHVDSDR